MDSNSPYTQENSEGNFLLRPPVIIVSRYVSDAAQIEGTEIVSPSKIFSCQICNKNFRSSIQLNKHIQKNKQGCRDLLESLRNH